MAKKNARNTRGRIVEAAWRLFYDQGYEDTTVEEMLFLNRELFRMIEDSVSIDLMARLLSTQLVTTGNRHLLDHKRIYYRLLRRIIAEGQAAGELTQSRSVNDMVKVYALCERALMYDWCLCGGDYSLAEYAARQLPVFLHDFLPETSSGNRSEETN